MGDYVPFSQRVGAEPAPQVGLQDMPPRLRTSLWNTFQDWLLADNTIPGQYPYQVALHVFDRLGWPADESRTIHQSTNLERVKKWFFGQAEWHHVYGFVEWLPRMIMLGTPEQFGGRDRMQRYAEQYAAIMSKVLEREGSPYRLSRGCLIPITDQVELDEVSRASSSPFAGARLHIGQAVTLLSMKPEPDYRNTIKESVSAIESALKEATGATGDFKPLLSAFEKKYGELHGAFCKAASALYGWTSDESGVRHGIFRGVDVDHADARFMLVTCSAFVNFLVQHAQTRG